MGERKGQNFYYPPDFNYKVHKSLNTYHGTHALRERAKKIKEGILVIRFEMPFNVWCLGCDNHVGMGVRYNAEKKKIGMYYTTPLYEFKMKCHLCDNYYIIRTDPKNFDYEMVEGLRRQEKRFDPSTIDNLAPVDRSFNQKLAADAMFKKEHDADDKKKQDSEETQVTRIEWIQTRMYDDYGINSYLRRSFRKEKSHLNEKRIADEDLQKRLSTNIKLQPESKDDKIIAKQMLKYKDTKSFEERSISAREELMQKSIFSSCNLPSSSKSDVKSILNEQIRKKKSTFTNFRKQDINVSNLPFGIIFPKKESSLKKTERKRPRKVSVPEEAQQPRANLNGSLAAIVMTYKSDGSSDND